MIWKFTAILAAAAPEVTPEDLKNARTASQGLAVSDLLLIIAVALLLLTALVCWAIFIRKPDQGEKRDYKKSRPAIQETEDGRIRKRKKHKSLRREHRQRNPTLSEAGGLPPIRPNEGPPPI